MPNANDNSQMSDMPTQKGQYPDQQNPLIRTIQFFSMYKKLHTKFLPKWVPNSVTIWLTISNPYLFKPNTRGTELQNMASKQLIICQFCGRSNFKSKHGLMLHLRNSQSCSKHTQELLGATTNKWLMTPTKLASLARNSVHYGKEVASDTIPGELDGINEQMAYDSSQEDNAISANLSNRLGEVALEDDVIGHESDTNMDDILVDANDQLFAQFVNYDSDDEAMIGDQNDTDLKAPSTEVRDQFYQYVEHAEQHFIPFTEEEVNAIKLMDTLAKKRPLWTPMTRLWNGTTVRLATWMRMSP